METLWFWLVGFMLGTYVVLDGLNLGAGMLHLFLARSEDEREQEQRANSPKPALKYNSKPFCASLHSAWFSRHIGRRQPLRVQR
jgi:Cytochrome bd terminal oxidase subunit II